MIIFGWGRTTSKDYGPVLARKCSNCSNERPWHLLQRRVWATLFFIPVFPYENKWYLLCPVCQFGVEPASEHIGDLTRWAVANQLLIEGRIDRDERDRRVNSTTTSESHPLGRLSALWRKANNAYTWLAIAVLIVLFAVSGDGASIAGQTAQLPTPRMTAGNPSPQIPDISLATGTVLKKNAAYLHGDGELKIENGTSSDAVAKLIRDGASVFSVYIKANSTYTIKNVSDGTYWLVFALGSNWDSGSTSFKRNAHYSSFDEAFDYQTREEGGYVHYSAWEVTLNPVVGGNAETSTIDPGQFSAY